MEGECPSGARSARTPPPSPQDPEEPRAQLAKGKMVRTVAERMEFWDQVPELRGGAAYLKLCRRGKAAAVVRHDDIQKITVELGVMKHISNEDLAALAPDPAVLKGRGTTRAVLKNKYISNMKALLTSFRRIDSEEVVDPFPGDRDDGLPNFTTSGVTLSQDFYRNYIYEVSVVHARMVIVFAFGFERAEAVHYEDMEVQLVA